MFYLTLVKISEFLIDYFKSYLILCDQRYRSQKRSFNLFSFRCFLNEKCGNCGRFEKGERLKLEVISTWKEGKNT
uniref:Uncharacterized protein n=1 Tax=Meloidogyne enterolobii TaxID=390850 RepID=A0A6V7WDG3_MELEN|nr:unnamed protein product [Meloidogyne enterolobii]